MCFDSREQIVHSKSLREPTACTSTMHIYHIGTDSDHGHLSTRESLQTRQPFIRYEAVD